MDVMVLVSLVRDERMLGIDFDDFFDDAIREIGWTILTELGEDDPDKIMDVMKSDAPLGSGSAFLLANLFNWLRTQDEEFLSSIPHIDEVLLNQNPKPAGPAGGFFL